MKGVTVTASRIRWMLPPPLEEGAAERDVVVTSR